MLIEWLPAMEEGGAASAMALLTATRMRSAECGMRNVEWKASSSSFCIPHSALRTPLVVVDRHGTFYPPAAAAWGMPLANMIVLRPTNARDEAWALDQALRSRAVAAVLAWPPRLDDRAFRRLQLAAESSGAIGLFVRPASARREPTWADVRLSVTCRVGNAHPTNFRLQIADCRSGSENSQSPNPQSGWHLCIQRLHARGCVEEGAAIHVEITSQGQIREVPPEAPKPDQSTPSNLKSAI
jgi:hypothetical protein